jgi:DNA-binding PadR family transcriptional regulator
MFCAQAGANENIPMNEAELTILSLVAEGPRYGYEIQQIIDERGLREWLAVGFSSIYYILNKLERQGMLSSQLRYDVPGPARKVYQVTEAGRGVLQTAVSDFLRQPQALGSGFELGLANVSALNPRQVYKALSERQTELNRRLEIVQKTWERHQREDNPIPDHVQALYTHHLAVMQAEQTWLKSFLDDWRTRYPAVTREEAPAAKSQGNDDATAIHRRTTPNDPAKMLQRLKRPPQPGE